MDGKDKTTPYDGNEKWEALGFQWQRGALQDRNPSKFIYLRIFLVFKAFSPFSFIVLMISSRFVGEVISETARSRQYQK